MADPQATFVPADEDKDDFEPSILFPGVDREDIRKYDRPDTDMNKSEVSRKPMIVAEPYDPHRIPPDFEAARRHKVGGM